MVLNIEYLLLYLLGDMLGRQICIIAQFCDVSQLISFAIYTVVQRYTNLTFSFYYIFIFVGVSMYRDRYSPFCTNSERRRHSGSSNGYTKRSPSWGKDYHPTKRVRRDTDREKGTTTHKNDRHRSRKSMAEQNAEVEEDIK